MLRRVYRNIKNNLLYEAERWVLWLPVFFGLGIGLYFSMMHEPSQRQVIGLVLTAAASLLLGRVNLLLKLISICVLTMALGFAAAKVNADISKTPFIYKLDKPVTISGHVAEISSSGGFPSLVLENLRIDEINQLYLPDQIKLGVRTKIDGPLWPGDRIITDAKLLPPARPALPGGFDFARISYFQGKGANGFAVKKITRLVDESKRSELESTRYEVSNRIRKAVEGDKGAMTDAIVTGDRSRITKEAYDDMRQSGLAHLIAISGINMVLAGGVMFFLIRFLISLSPRLSERFNPKKTAAVLAILGATFYLLISGMQVPAVRAYMMFVIILVGILADRAATPMRSVALSALIIMAFAPQSILGPGFQMSYAATIALICGYELIRRNELEGYNDSGRIVWYRQFWNKLWLYPLTVMGTSLIAGLATAPYSAYHFNQFVNYGLAANLMAIPITSFVVMPFIVIGLIAMPLGLEDIPLYVAGEGNGWILDVAHYIASLPQSSINVPQITTWGLVLITFGGLWFFIWQRRWRYFGALPVIIGLLSPLTVTRPDILINETGKLFAINYQDKLYFSNLRDSFASREWLDAFAQKDQEKLVKQDEYDLGIYKLTFGCKGDNSFYIHSIARDLCISAEDLEQKGAHAIYLNKDSIRVETVEDRRGKRPWTR